MPLPLFGTNTSFDTIASSQQTIAQVGPEHVWDGVASLLNTYNRQTQEFLDTFCERTTDRMRKYGGATQLRMQRMDEVGTPNAQKIKAGSIVGFPMEDLGIALQWTRLYWKNRTVSEFAAQVDAGITADKASLIRAIKIALMMGINYSFTDYRVDHVDNQFALPVKALCNADGAPIPPGPNGEIFNPSTHTHYLATATLTDAWATALVETVLEHNPDGTAIVWINRADEAAWTALASFNKIVYDNIIRATTQEYGVGVKNTNDLANRLIGYYKGAHIWVKPYLPQYYTICFMQDNGKPALAYRVRGTTANGGGPEADGAGELTLAYEDEEHPLYARAWEREFGMGVYYRTSAAVGFFNGSVYVAPDPSTF